MHSHWFAFPFLIPFPILLVIHRQLAMSDALMVQTPPGEREAHLFNWILVLVAYAGAGTFLMHSFSLWRRGWHWFCVKGALLLTYWFLALTFA